MSKTRSLAVETLLTILRRLKKKECENDDLSSRQRLIEQSLDQFCSNVGKLSTKPDNLMVQVVKMLGPIHIDVRNGVHNASISIYCYSLLVKNCRNISDIYQTIFDTNNPVKYCHNDFISLLMSKIFEINSICSGQDLELDALLRFSSLIHLIQNVPEPVQFSVVDNFCTTFESCLSNVKVLKYEEKEEVAKLCFLALDFVSRNNPPNQTDRIFHSVISNQRADSLGSCLIQQFQIGGRFCTSKFCDYLLRQLFLQSSSTKYAYLPCYTSWFCVLVSMDLKIPESGGNECLKIALLIQLASKIRHWKLNSQERVCIYQLASALYRCLKHSDEMKPFKSIIEENIFFRLRYWDLIENEDEMRYLSSAFISIATFYLKIENGSEKIDEIFGHLVTSVQSMNVDLPETHKCVMEIVTTVTEWFVTAGKSFSQSFKTSIASFAKFSTSLVKSVDDENKVTCLLSYLSFESFDDKKDVSQINHEIGKIGDYLGITLGPLKWSCLFKSKKIEDALDITLPSILDSMLKNPTEFSMFCLLLMENFKFDQLEKYLTTFFENVIEEKLIVVFEIFIKTLPLVQLSRLLFKVDKTKLEEMLLKIMEHFSKFHKCDNIDRMLSKVVWLLNIILEDNNHGPTRIARILDHCLPMCSPAFGSSAPLRLSPTWKMVHKIGQRLFMDKGFSTNQFKQASIAIRICLRFLLLIFLND